MEGGSCRVKEFSGSVNPRLSSRPGKGLMFYLLAESLFHEHWLPRLLTSHNKISG